jgi:integrase
MAKRTLNDWIIKALKPAPAGQRREVWDALVPGLGVRTTETGAKSFVLATRYPGSPNPARRTLGAYGELTLEQARNKARHWLDLVHHGVDPQTEVERQRLAEQRKRANTFAAVAGDFIALKVSKERRGFEAERIIRRELLPAWGDRAITDIVANDVMAVIRPLAARAPCMARNTLATAKRLFGWAIDQQVYGLETSPADRLKSKRIIGERPPRQRVLGDDELFAFWRATGRMSYPFGPLLRMLLLTGQRHMDVAHAPWSEFKLEQREWTIAAGRFKSAASQLVPLTDQMLALLNDLPQFKSGNFLFSTNHGVTPTRIADKTRLDARMLRILQAMARRRGEDPSAVELQPWVVHDLRRTMRTRLAALRVSDQVAEMVIGHGKKGLRRIYDQHEYKTEMREALELWGARLRSIVEPPPPNVVALRAVP